MRNPGGYAIITTPEPSRVHFDRLRCEDIPAGVTERDSFTCFHCNSVVHVKPRMDPADLGGLCKACMKFICPRCVGHGCTPWEKRMERHEARDRALRSYGF